MMQGYTVASRYDSDDYDDLLALSCDACSEQVRHFLCFSILFTMSGNSNGAYLTQARLYLPLRVT